MVNKSIIIMYRKITHALTSACHIRYAYHSKTDIRIFKCMKVWRYPMSILKKTYFLNFFILKPASPWRLWKFLDVISHYLTRYKEEHLGLSMNIKAGPDVLQWIKQINQNKILKQSKSVWKYRACTHILQKEFWIFP